MRRHIGILVLAFAAAVPITATPAAAVGEYAGDDCSLVATPDPGTEATYVYTGVVNGGPVATSLGSLEITCAIQVGGSGTYTDPDVYSASASGTGVTHLLATAAFIAPAESPAYLCTTWRWNGGDTWYLDYNSGNFSRNPAASACGDILCVAVIGCNDRDVLICVAVIGCNSDAPICVAGIGCNPPPPSADGKPDAVARVRDAGRADRVLSPPAVRQAAVRRT